MSDIFELDTEGQRALEAQARANPVTLDQITTGTYSGVPKAIGMGFMRGGARAAQAVGMAGGGVLSILDGGTGSLTDPYFKALDDTVGNAVDYWTPGANEVGTAGRILGGFSEMALPLMAGGGNPSLLIGSAEMGGALDLSKQGASNTGAVAGGVIEGLANAVGFKIPFLGSTLAKRMLSGMAGNVAVDAIGGGLEKTALNLTGDQQQAANVHPLYPESLLIDLLSGAAFGGIAHLTAPPRAVRANSSRPTETLDQIQELMKDPESRYFKGPSAEDLQQRYRDLTQQAAVEEDIRAMRAMMQPSVRDAVATAANAKHFQFDSAPGDPADISASIAHQKAMESAVRDTLAGEPVDLSGTGIDKADFISRAHVPAFTEMPEELQGVDEAIKEQPSQNPDRVDLPENTEPTDNLASRDAKLADPAVSSARTTINPESVADSVDREQRSLEDPVVSYARNILAEMDFPMAMGTVDQDGRVITQSAREILDQSDRDIAAARNDAKAFKALVGCMLTRGAG